MGLHAYIDYYFYEFHDIDMNHAIAARALHFQELNQVAYHIDKLGQHQIKDVDVANKLTRT